MAETSAARDGAPAVAMEFDRALLKQCVHCGLCLDACPTYRVIGTEMDGPRGRIYQIKSVYEGRIAPDDPHYAEHIYACLDCRACQTVCPAGVQYGALIEGARGRGHGVRVGGELFSDAMGADGTPEGTYTGMVRHNVSTIVAALLGGSGSAHSSPAHTAPGAKDAP